MPNFSGLRETGGSQKIRSGVSGAALILLRAGWSVDLPVESSRDRIRAQLHCKQLSTGTSNYESHTLFTSMPSATGRCAARPVWYLMPADVAVAAAGNVFRRNEVR
jgi:hypothetical protein